jgi:hypothetical protein
LKSNDIDITRAVAIIADSDPPAIRRTWVKGLEPKDKYQLAFEPWAGDSGHGEPLTLVWILIKAGYRDQLLEQAVHLPSLQADKIFAMLASFDDEVLRHAAARHFALPDFPTIMETVFASHLTLKQHIAIAEFGHKHPRYRAALALAMRSYGLHIYSNYRPTVDWSLAGLEHFTLAHGCQLLFFFIHHPEDEPVLAQMVNTGWLPDGVSTGGYDAYSNTASFYYRAASFYIGLNQAPKFADWMGRPWIADRLTMAKDRETFRLLGKLL